MIKKTISELTIPPSPTPEHLYFREQDKIKALWNLPHPYFHYTAQEVKSGVDDELLIALNGFVDDELTIEYCSIFISTPNQITFDVELVSDGDDPPKIVELESFTGVLDYVYPFESIYSLISGGLIIRLVLK